MKIKILATTLLVIMALLMVPVTPAFAVPPAPSGFWGTIKVGGSNVPDGTYVRAVINGIVYANTQTMTYEGDSVYSLLVPGDDPSTLSIVEGGVDGNTITFTIGGLTASPTGVWHSGPNIEFNLTATPTAVMLDSFTAKPQLNTTQLDWETASENTLIGFNIYRSETVGGLKQKQNQVIIPALHSGQNVGDIYQYVNPVAQGLHYFYWLELVFVNGSSQTDPIEITSDYLMFVPSVLK